MRDCKECHHCIYSGECTKTENNAAYCFVRFLICELEQNTKKIKEDQNR